MRLLEYTDYISIAYGSCQLLKDLTVNPNLDPVQYISQTIPWCKLEKFDLGLFEYNDPKRPRLLLGETTVNGRKTLVVSFRETKGVADWADNTKVLGSIDAFIAESDFYSGNMHSGFRARAKLLPLGPIFERLASNWDVVFTGYSQGSAVAEAATIMLMNNTGWKTQWLQQVIFLGFASPLLHDKTFASELLVDHYKNDPTEQRSLILHHFVYRQDIVPRALTICGSVNRAFSEQLSAWLEYSATATVALELGKLIIPDYQPCGIWHLLSGDTVQHLQAHDTDHLKILQDEIFFPWKVNGKLNLEAKHLQHHGNNHYQRELQQYYPTLFASGHIAPPLRSSLAPITSSNTTTEAWWDKGHLKVLVQGPNVMWADTITVNYHGQLFTFPKEMIGICSYHQIVVSCVVPDVPSAHVVVEIVSSLSANKTKFTAIPQVYSNTTANEYLQKCSMPELLRIASLVSLLTHPTVQNPAINTVTTLLTKIIEHVPLEVIFLPLANGNKLSDPARDFLKHNEPPSFQMLSEVGVAIIRAAFHTLENTQGALSYVELASDLATVINFVSQGIRKYALSQARRESSFELQEYYNYIGLASVGSIASANATIAVCAPLLFSRAPTPNPEIVTERVEELKAALDKLLSNFRRVLAHQFCGLSMGDISASTYVTSILTQKRTNIANLENKANQNRSDINCRKDVLKQTTTEIEQFGVLVDQVTTFFSEGKQKELGGKNFDISVTATPSKWYLHAPKRLVGTIAQSVYGTVGGSAALVHSAATGSTVPLVDFSHNLVKLERWIATQPKTFPTYEDFVVWLAQYMAKTQNASVAEGVWNAEAYILSVADKPDALDSPETAKHMWTTISRFADFPDHFKFGTSCRMQQIACVHELRNVLSSLPLIGLFGTSNSGKTFLMKKVLGNIPGVVLPDSGPDLARRTVFPRIYSHPLQTGVCVLDTMGLDDPELEKSSRLLFTIPKVVVLLTDATDHAHGTTSELLKHTANVIAGRPPQNSSWVSCLTLLNKVDRFYEDDDNPVMTVLDREEQQRPASHTFPAVIRNNVSFPRWWASLYPKEFENREIPTQLQYHPTDRPKGIHSLQDVLDWITQATHDNGMDIT